MQGTSVYISNKQKKKSPEGKGFQDTWTLHQLPRYKTTWNHSSATVKKISFYITGIQSQTQTTFPLFCFQRNLHLPSHPHPLHFVFISPKHRKLIPRANLWVAKPTATQKQVKSSAHSNKILYGRGRIQDIRQGRGTGRKTTKIWYYLFQLQPAIKLISAVDYTPPPQQRIICFQHTKPPLTWHDS